VTPSGGEVRDPEPVKVEVSRLPHLGELPLPRYMSDGASGMDLCAAIEDEVTLEQGCHGLIPTGIALAIPTGFEGQVRPRSGLALKHGVLVLNTPGTVDSDYRGEVKVILANLGSRPFVVRRGDRIAQLVVTPVARVEWAEREDLAATSRDSGGFGHTGQ